MTDEDVENTVENDESPSPPSLEEEIEGEETESSKPTLEELLELARQGWYIWVDKRIDKIRLRDPETGRSISIPYDPEIYDRLRKARKEGMKERGEKTGSETPRRSPAVTSDITLWNTFIGKHRPLIESLISRVAWLQDAVIDIGINTLLFTLMISNEKPDTLIDTLKQIKDKDVFIGYVMDKLVTLYLSSKGLEEVDKLRERIKELELENAVLYEALQKKTGELEKIKKIATDLKTKLDIALSIMNSDELRRLMKIYLMASITEYFEKKSEEKEVRQSSPPEEEELQGEAS